MLKAVRKHQEVQARHDNAQLRLHQRQRRLLRRQVLLEAEKVQENKHKNACAELVQALFHGIVARKYAAFLRKLRDAATKIQLMARSHAARKEFKRLLRIKYRWVLLCVEGWGLCRISAASPLCGFDVLHRPSCRVTVCVVTQSGAHQVRVEAPPGSIHSGARGSGVE